MRGIWDETQALKHIHEMLLTETLRLCRESLDRIVCEMTINSFPGHRELVLLSCR